MNKVFKKYGKKKYRETRFVFGWFEAEVKRGVFRYLGLNIADICTSYSFTLPNDGIKLIGGTAKLKLK